MSETNAAPVVDAGTTESQADVNSESAGADANTVPKQPKPAITEAEVKAAVKKYKLKFGKQEREVDENQIVNLAQKGWASDEKFQKAASKEKQFAALVEKFKDDPDALIKYLGHDPIEIYKRQLAKELQRKVMTPEQRELMEAREKLAKYEAGEKDRAAKEHEEKISKLQTHYEQQYDKEMSEAIVAAGLPKTAKTIKRAAQLAYKNLEMGLDLPWPAIMEMVRDEYKEDMRDLFGNSEADKLVEMFGPDIAKKITKASLKNRVIDPEPVDERTRAPAKPRDTTQPSKYADDDDWEEKMKKFKNS